MSKQSISLLALTATATATLAASRFVTQAGAYPLADGNTFGVVKQAAVSGEKITVDVVGTAVVEAGAAIVVGDTLKVDATGRAITWATSGAKVAIALQAAGAAGDFIEVLLITNVA